MNKTFKTEQEAFWAGEFGNVYINRNDNDQLIAGIYHFFPKFYHTYNTRDKICY